MCGKADWFPAASKILKLTASDMQTDRLTIFQSGS